MWELKDTNSCAPGVCTSLWLYSVAPSHGQGINDGITLDMSPGRPSYRHPGIHEWASRVSMSTADIISVGDYVKCVEGFSSMRSFR